MTTSTLLDYNADARTRLWELLERRNVGYRDRLKQSADTAGAQLEWSKPCVMGSAKHDNARFYGGPAVAAPPGTVFIVLAHRKKVLTLWLRSAPGNTLTDAVEYAVSYAKEAVESEAPGFEWSGDRVLIAVEDLIKKHGRTPGKEVAELSQEHNLYIIGILFAAMPDEARVGTIKGLEMIIGIDVCPAMVCLLGKGSVTGLCGAWPLVLPLAPYVDAVIETEEGIHGHERAN